MHRQFIEIRPLDKTFSEWVEDLLRRHWGSEKIVTRGRTHHATGLPGFVALQNGVPFGLVTYHITGRDCEIVTLNSEIEEVGFGSLLINAVREAAMQAGCHRIWLITTNDNLRAIRFYQKRLFRLKAVYPDAIQESRKLKPEIALTGQDDIPILDEIEMELLL